MMTPVRLLIRAGSYEHSKPHIPAKSASTYTLVKNDALAKAEAKLSVIVAPVHKMIKSHTVAAGIFV